MAAEVVVNMVAMILEDIIVFILAFPTGTATSSNLWRVRLIQHEAGYPLVAIEDFAGSFMADLQITPVDWQSIIAAT